jgi:hypothetical protein
MVDIRHRFEEPYENFEQTKSCGYFVIPTWLSIQAYSKA